MGRQRFLRSAQHARCVNDKQACAAGLVMTKWECIICGHVYDEAIGDPENGVAAGTLWQDVPESWLCPDCGASKADFVLME